MQESMSIFNMFLLASKNQDLRIIHFTINMIPTAQAQDNTKIGEKKKIVQKKG